MRWYIYNASCPYNLHLMKAWFYDILFSTDFFPFLIDYNKEHTTGVTCQQRMLTQPLHLIVPINCEYVRVCSTLVMYFSFGLLILNTGWYQHISFSSYYINFLLFFFKNQIILILFFVCVFSLFLFIILSVYCNTPPPPAKKVWGGI